MQTPSAEERQKAMFKKMDAAMADILKNGDRRAANTPYIPGVGSWSGDGEIMQDFDPTGRVYANDYEYDNRPPSNDMAAPFFDPNMPVVVVPGKRLSKEDQEAWYKQQMRASMPDYGRAGPVAKQKAPKGSAPSAEMQALWNKLNAGRGTRVNFGALAQFEGGQQLKGYVPRNRSGDVLGKSGVTVATGFDIGQMDAKEIRRLALDKSLADELVPYAAKIKNDAVSYLNKNPLEITRDEAMAIDFSIKDKHLKAAINSWEKRRLADTPAFVDLTEAQQTVIVSRTFHQGTGMPNIPLSRDFYNAALENRWVDAEIALRNYDVDPKWYQARVAKEAALLTAERNRNGR